MKSLIGKSTLLFNDKGIINFALFTPEPTIVKEEHDLSGFRDIVADKDESLVLKQAETVMSKWFTTLDNYELADREQFKIISEMNECKKYDDGKPMKVTISFYFVDIPAKANS